MHLRLVATRPGLGRGDATPTRLGVVCGETAHGRPRELARAPKAGRGRRHANLQQLGIAAVFDRLTFLHAGLALLDLLY